MAHKPKKSSQILIKNNISAITSMREDFFSKFTGILSNIQKVKQVFKELQHFQTVHS